MSPLFEVPPLQSCSLHFALTEIHERLQNGQKKELREFLIATLHGGIRQQLIDLAITKYWSDVNFMIDIVGLLVDSSVRRIEPKPEMLYLTVSQCDALFTQLDRSDATGLHELIVQVQLNHKGDPKDRVPACSNSLGSLHQLLARGLAENLRVLTLRKACDNTILTLLGRHAVHLTHLNIACNWLVDDIGIRHLLLKNPNCLSFPPDLDSCEGSVLHELSTVPDDGLTGVCFSLQEVKIQDTNTSGMSVLMLLMFIKNLKSLGGFIYYRNVGDAILMLQPYCPTLALTDLWDMHLPPEKSQKMATAVPNLTTLYTRASQLPIGELPFKKLRNMTIDFDFSHFGPQFSEFLAFNGAALTKLFLIDQVYSLDITVIAEHCPLLSELGAKVCVNDQHPSARLPTLKTAKLRISSAETFRWLFLNCDNIERLEVLMEQNEDWHIQGFGYALDNKVITELANSHPPSFDSVEYLSIFLTNDFVGRLNSEALRILIASCKRLRYLDDLQTWCCMREQEVLTVVSETVSHNVNIDIRYKGISLTDFYRSNKHYHNDVSVQSN